MSRMSEIDSSDAVSAQQSLPDQPATDTTAVDKVMGVYELVEMILCELPLFDIAQAQRVCKTFRDVVKNSKDMPRVAARKPWLFVDPAERDQTGAVFGRPGYWKMGLIFDNGDKVPRDLRYVQMTAPPLTSQVRRTAAMCFSERRDLPKRYGTVLTATQDVLSAPLWHFVPIAHGGVRVRVELNMTMKKTGTVITLMANWTRAFAGTPTLGDLSDWLSTQAQALCEGRIEGASFTMNLSRSDGEEIRRRSGTGWDWFDDDPAPSMQ